MFLHLSVILSFFGGVCLSACWDTTPWADTPQQTAATVDGTRVPTQPGKPGKPGKMRVHLENLEISWNFEKFNKYHGKMT